MQRLRSLALLLATLGGIMVLAVAPVAADSGSDSGSGGDSGSGDSSSSQTSSDSSSTDGSNDTQSSDTNQTESTSGDSNAHDLLDQLHGDAKSELAKLRHDEHKDSSETERQHACKNLQSNIDNHITDFSDSAQRHLNVFTDIFTKVQAFYTSKGLSVSNYDALVAAATAKQTAAQAAVDALKSLAVSIDCSQPDPAQSLQTVKDAVKTARTALQDYRSSIKDLIVAISNALDTQDTTTGGGQ